MKQTIYTVHACRWGDTETHSYIVGVYAKKQAALNAAITEEEYRGGKYGCEVLEWVMNEGRAGNHDVEPKVIKPLPTINRMIDEAMNTTPNDQASGTRSVPLVERLRQARHVTRWVRGLDTDYPAPWEPDPLCQEAATEIERLRKALSDERLRHPRHVRALP